MALNLAALQQPLRRVDVPDQMERRKSLADLQRVEQAGQLQQMQISEAERQAALRPLIEKAITDAIDPATGDIDYKKAAAAIMPHDQEIGQSFMTFAGQQQQSEINRGLQTRKAQLENVDILEATPAPEITATAPTATGMPYPGQLSPGPTMGGGTQQVPVPIPEQEISGIPALGVAPAKVRPTSPQQKINMMREEERRKLQLAQEFRPDRFASSPQGIFDTGTGKVTAPFQKPEDLTFQEQTYKDYLSIPELVKKYGASRIGFEEWQADLKKAAAAAGKAEAGSYLPYTDKRGVVQYWVNPKTKQVVRPNDLGIGDEAFKGAMSMDRQTRETAASSGLRAITRFREELKKNPNMLAQLAIPGSPGARIARAARNELADVLTRIRTGAALNEYEQEFYNSQAPGFLDQLLDDPATVEYKLSIFEDQFKGLAPPQKPEQPNGGGGGGTAPIVQRNKKTREIRHSIDGGKTWRKGPPSQ